MGPCFKALLDTSEPQGTGKEDAAAIEVMVVLMSLQQSDGPGAATAEPDFPRTGAFHRASEPSLSVVGRTVEG